MPKPSSEELHSALKEHFGFDTFKGNQEAVISSLLEEKDVFVLMPTGGGKSLCYQLPALLMNGTAIVISPLIALMKNQVDAIRHFSEVDYVAHFLNSSLGKAAIERVKDDVMSGATKLLYVAPESFSKADNMEFFKQMDISFYAIDEAHCISEWGHDFRPEYRRIRPVVNEVKRRPIIALTATATQKVQHDIQKTLGILDADVYKSSFNRPNLYYEIRPKTADVDKEIIKFIKANKGKAGIIYCLARRKVEELANLLQVNGIKALPYHAGMDSVTRFTNQDAFILEKADVIVATIAFGMGIDKPDVRFVIHYDMPKSLEGYYQETGRAGRDGAEGRCIAFYAAKDLQKMEKFLQDKPINEQEIGRQLLRETAAYAESAVCRRHSLLFYFGEDYQEGNCGNCDNCLHPKTQIEVKDELAAILETVVETKERHKQEVIIDILRGKKSADVLAYHHDQLDTFGTVTERDERFLSTVIRQAVLAGLMAKDIEKFGILRATASGLQFILAPHSFKIVEDTDFGDYESPDSAMGTSAADEELYEILKDLRKKKAKSLNLPSYVIFQDPSLESMATTYPVTLEELQNIPGVGSGKAKRYGKEFVDVIKKYVEENEIERPEDWTIRTVANKSKLKISIIQAIDRKTPLPELAVAKGLEFDELLDEIEGIVYAGNKLNIDYYINDSMDDDAIEEIFDYFRNSETDDLKAAYDEFEGDYTEQEIRLIRIHFISEMGN